MTTQPYHIPALFTESLDALNIKGTGVYVAATAGAFSNAFRKAGGMAAGCSRLTRTAMP